MWLSTYGDFLFYETLLHSFKANARIFILSVISASYIYCQIRVVSFLIYSFYLFLNYFVVYYFDSNAFYIASYGILLNEKMRL